MGKKRKRRTLGPPSPDVLEALKAGKVIAVSRPDAIARLLDTAVWLWFFEKDPLSIHLLVVAAYNCLDDMGKKTGKAPRFKEAVSPDHFSQAYDFLRHASSEATAHIAFPPAMNALILFDAAHSFERIFGKLTMYMHAFRAYFLIFGVPDYQPRKDLRERAADFLPEGVTVQEVEGLGRLEFFAKLTEMFSVQYRAKQAS
jgi:hypothetical protein